MASNTPLRRELLIQFAGLFAGAFLLAVIGLALLLPALDSPARGTLFIFALVVADLGVLFVFGQAVLQHRLVRPMESLSADARLIADGDYHHRIGEMESIEFQQIRDSVNEMADRLIADQQLLAENVRSLEDTNCELIVARDQIVHTARLASVGSLAAGIAHEVGNPLGAILAFVDVAKARVQDSGGDTEILDSVRNEAMRIDRIVRSLLDYARPREPEIGPTPPETVLRRVRELLDSQGKLDAVEDAWEVEAGVPDVVMEPHRLEQVMVNLLLNAIDAVEGRDDRRLSVRLYGDDGDVMKLPIRRVDDPPGINYRHRRRVSKDDGGKGVDPVFTAQRVAVIEVADSGPGIPEEDLDTVFDPFYTTKEPGKGTGLGLSICARLIDGMGGRIEATNDDKGGARFVIRLPATEVMDAAEGNPDGEHQAQETQ